MARPTVELQNRLQLLGAGNEPARLVNLPSGLRIASGVPAISIDPGLPTLFVENRDTSTAISALSGSQLRTVEFAHREPEAKVANVYLQNPKKILVDGDFIDQEPSLLERVLPGALVSTRRVLSEAFEGASVADGVTEKPLFEARRGGLSRLNANVVLVEHVEDEVAPASQETAPPVKDTNLIPVTDEVTEPTLQIPAPVTQSNGRVRTVPAPVVAPPPGQGSEVPGQPETKAERKRIDGLVAGAVSGDRKATDLLMREIQPMVLKYCRGKLGLVESSRISADDVASEVMLAVLSALPNYKIMGLSFRAFVFGIAGHKVIDAHRAASRIRAEPVAELPEIPISDNGPDERFLRIEQAEALNQLLNKLTPKQREILLLRLAVELSAEETAQAVGSTPGGVRVAQHRALARLRKHLGLVTGKQDSTEESDSQEADLAEVVLLQSPRTRRSQTNNSRSIDSRRRQG